MPMSLTEAAKALLPYVDYWAYIRDCIKTNHWPPTPHEIVNHFKQLHRDSTCGDRLAELLIHRRNNSTIKAALSRLLTDPGLVSLLHASSKKAENENRKGKAKFNNSKPAYKKSSLATQTNSTNLERKVPVALSQRPTESPRSSRPRVLQHETITRTEPSGRSHYRHNKDEDFSIILLREKARNYKTPLKELLQMCTPEFQPYLGIELSENPALPDEGLRMLLNYPPSNKKVLQKLLRRIAGHPNASPQTLNMVLEAAKQVGINNAIQNKIAARTDFTHL